MRQSTREVAAIQNIFSITVQTLWKHQNINKNKAVKYHASTPSTIFASFRFDICSRVATLFLRSWFLFDLYLLHGRVPRARSAS